MRRFFFSLLFAPFLGCGKPFWTPLPSRPTPLNLDDSRRALIGTWKIAFAADTIEIVADSVSSPPRYTRIAGGSSWTTGTLQLRDTLVASESDELFARFDIDFAPILTRPMSCFEAGEGRVGVRRNGATVHFWFTPNWNDCGFAGTARFYGDSLVGTWGEESFAGSPSFGRFRMLRLPSPR